MNENAPRRIVRRTFQGELIVLIGVAMAGSALELSSVTASSLRGHAGTPLCAASADSGNCRTGRQIEIDPLVQGAMLKWQRPMRPCVIKDGNTDSFSFGFIQIIEDVSGGMDEWVEFGFDRTTEALEGGTPQSTGTDEGPNQLLYGYGTAYLDGSVGGGTWTPYTIEDIPYGEYIQLRKTVDGRRWRLFVGEKMATPMFPVDHATNARIVAVGGETNYWQNDLGVLLDQQTQVRWSGSWKSWFPTNLTGIDVASIDNSYPRYVTDYKTAGEVLLSSDHHFPPGAIDACGEHTFPTSTSTP